MVVAGVAGVDEGTDSLDFSGVSIGVALDLVLRLGVVFSDTLACLSIFNLSSNRARDFMRFKACRKREGINQELLLSVVYLHLRKH